MLRTWKWLEPTKPTQRQRCGICLNRGGIATLFFDLLTRDEEADRRNVFDVELLAQRLIAATRWLFVRPATRGLPIGYFGASTGAAAALLAAAELGDEIAAVVLRGGRLRDLAQNRLGDVKAPTLLIVGGADRVVLDLDEPQQQSSRVRACSRSSRPRPTCSRSQERWIGSRSSLPTGSRPSSQLLNGHLRGLRRWSEQLAATDLVMQPSPGGSA